MNLYAVTYTDPSEPWGSAVYDRKLYRTPGEVLTALNEVFDRYVADADYLRSRYHGYMDKYFPTVEAYIEDEFSREYSVGIYNLVGE